MIALRTHAIDRGVRLMLGGDKDGVELRLGWVAARRLARDISRAMTLDPPWVSSGEVWADQMLEIGEQGIGVSKGAGCEPLNQGFIRVIGVGLDVGGVLDAPTAVFASDDEPDYRFLAANPSFDLRDRGGVAIEVAAEFPRGREDGPVGGGAEVLVATGTVIGDHDEESVIAGHAEITEAHDGEALVGTPAGRSPLDGDMAVALDDLIEEVRQAQAGLTAKVPGPGVAR